MTQGDGSGEAPATADIIESLERTIERDALRGEIEWATRANPLNVAQRIASLMRENAELRAAVKSTAPTVALQTYKERDYLAASLVTSAHLLEERGDRCHVDFARDREGKIYGLVLSVEDL